MTRRVRDNWTERATGRSTVPHTASGQPEPDGVRHVWVVNHHALIPSKDGARGRHLRLARGLKSHQWRTSLIVASTAHPSGAQKMRGLALSNLTQEDGVPALWVRTVGYRRLRAFRALGMAAFATVLLLPGVTRPLRRPDVVVGSTVHPLAAWAASRLAKRHRVPFVFEVRDVWPDALVELGAIRESGVLARLTRSLMRRLADRANVIISPLPFVGKWLEEVGVHGKPFYWVSNGADVETGISTPARSTHNSFTFMYLGSHGNANRLDIILEAFDRACAARPDLKLRLRLVGSGPQKQRLVEYASRLPSAATITFEDRIPQGEVQARAAEADCLVATLDSSPVYRFGVAPNKVFGYLATGRPVVWASSAPNNPVRDAQAGFCVPSDDIDAFADALIRMAETTPEQRNEMGERGMNLVRTEYSFDVLAASLAHALETAVGAHATGQGQNAE